MIQIENLYFDYPKSKGWIFENTNLTISKGSIYGLLGKNGTGKSTLLRLISGLLTPKQGRVSVDSFSSHMRRAEMLEKLFFLPEDFSLPRVTPREFAEIYGKFYPRFSHSEFLELLSKLEVEPDKKLHSMSFGQRKKGYIAFALAVNTDILLMDEPTNGLDIPSKSVFRRLVAGIASPERVIIISTHQVRDLEELIDHVLILDGNQFLVNSSTEEITRRLSFSQLDDVSGALYFEKSVHGTVGVTPNDGTSAQTGLDMELLFNAAVANRQYFIDTFIKK